MRDLSFPEIITEVVELPEVDSTNRYALEHGRPGLLVLADTQTAGRGRRGRSWFSPGGMNLYMTVTMAPPEERYPIIAGIAVRSALGAILPQHTIAIKWPNDIIVQGKKVCGILCETRSGITAVGMGINVNQDTWPQGLEHRATSLARVSGQRFDVREVARTVTEHLAERFMTFRTRGFAPIREEFLRYGLLEGYDVVDDQGRSCTLTDLTMDGYLIINSCGVRRILRHESVSIGWAEES